ncbi:MAG: hypothetical protein U0Q11_05870 [Vicinamibacterales bacterium]
MKAPAHLHVAARILDRCGVDEAIIGDILEAYEARPSAARVWREVTAALVSHAARYARDHKPQVIQRAAIAAGVIALIAAWLPAGARIDLAHSVRVEDLSGGWSVGTAADGRARLLPTVSFQLRNVSSTPLASVQVNVIFHRAGDRDVWSDVVRHAIDSRAVASGITTGPIVAQAPIGYTGDEDTKTLLTHPQFVDSSVSIYARHGAAHWTYLGDYPLPRAIVQLDRLPSQHSEVPAPFEQLARRTVTAPSTRLLGVDPLL